MITKNEPAIEIESYTEPKIPQVDFGDDYMEAFEKSIVHRTRIVERILKQSEPAKNQDWILTLLGLKIEFPEIKLFNEKDNLHVIIPLSTIRWLPNPDAYGRIRRKFNEDGFYMATDDTVIERRMKQKAYQNHFRRQQHG